MQRRQLLKGSALLLAGGALQAGCSTANPLARAVAGEDGAVTKTGATTAPAKLKGNIRHSVARWTYGDLSLEALCELVLSLGFAAIDLVGPDEWPVLKRYGIDSSMCNGAEINLVHGWCNAEFHDELSKRYARHIDLVADAGYKNLICFAGNARGLSRSAALDAAVRGLAPLVEQAQRRGVVLQMELFNSRVDHPDYLADNSDFGIALCQRLGSEHFKLLFDIYHMQIMEGDIIRRIRQHGRFFGHYHTAGVPGRHEIGGELGALQELNYPAIAKAIKDSGFTGYLAQEFIPTPATAQGRAQSLRDAIAVCDV
jgi:hydroxypyruvate isomerase